MNRANVVIYSRPGCHLCDDAKQLLERYGLQPTIVNIDEDPRLKAAYSTSIPVVTIDDQERFRGRVNEVLLQRLLSKHSSANANEGNP